MKIADSMCDAAISWYTRLSGATSASDWEAFIVWLEADVANARAYELVEHVDENLAGLKRDCAANDNSAYFSRRWPAMLGGGIVAGLVAMLAIPHLSPYMSSAVTQDIVTRAGEHRLVHIGPNTVTLNGDTHIVMTPGNTQRLKLIHGEARFRVQHDPAHPFVLVLGRGSVQDIGTVFNVVRDDSGVQVDIAEGSAAYTTPRGRLVASAGQSLRATADDSAVQMSHKDVALIGQWGGKQLSFRAERLDSVAREIARTTGIVLVVAPALADQRFTGTVQLAGASDAIAPRLASILGITAEHSAEGWQLKP